MTPANGPLIDSIKQIDSSMWDQHSKTKIKSLLSSLANNDVDSESILQQIALIALTHNEQKLAATIFTDLSTNSSIPDHDYYLAEIAIATNDHPLAYKHILDGLLKAGAKDKILFYLLRSEALIDQGELQKADNTIQKVLKYNKKDYQAVYLEAKINLLNGKCQKAIDGLVQLINWLPGYNQFYPPLSSAYRMCGHNELADKFAGNYSAETLVFQNRFINQKQNLGNPVKTLKNEIKVLILRKDYHNAIPLLNKLIKLEPDESATHINLGSMYYYLNNTSAAKQSFLRALELEPQNIKAITNLGNVALQGNDLVLAEQRFQQVLSIQPDHSKALLNLASIKLQFNLPTEAELLFHKTLSINANHQAAKNGLIMSLILQNRHDEAFALVNKWIKQNPDSHLILAGQLMLQDFSPDLEQVKFILKLIEDNMSNKAQLIELFLLLELKYFPSSSDANTRFLELTGYSKNSTEARSFSENHKYLSQNTAMDLRIFK
ncbi:MAG: tetratricopeptide repeat protein [Proteobacteria bacterium]|nr:tetratricopeptide repeat protein [Pseudomonadota bacterium]